MKKTFFYLCAVAVMAFFMSSCSSTAPVHTEQYPKYVSVEKLLSVELGSSFDQVVKYMGCAPVDLISRQKDGYSIYVYKYKILYRDLDPNLFNTRGSETSGNESYVDDLKSVYLFFKGDKLMDIQTENGLRFSAQWVMINNTLYNISKNGTGFNPENMTTGGKDVVPQDDTKKEAAPAEQGSSKLKLPFFKGNKK
jgi:hypothetical protein